MSIFRTKFQNDFPFKEGEYLATMLRMDWKDTKAGDPMMIVEFRTIEGRAGKAIFPQVNAFFEDEAKQACEVLLNQKTLRLSLGWPIEMQAVPNSSCW